MTPEERADQILKRLEDPAIRELYEMGGSLIGYRGCQQQERDRLFGRNRRPDPETQKLFDYLEGNR